MITSDDLRNLRAGPVIAAGRMSDATVRGLVANHGLKLGDREARETGNPRYDLADCARVFMLHLLMNKARQPGAAAVWAVNAAYPYISEIAEAELCAIDTGDAPECPRYEAVLSVFSLDVETNPEIRLWSDPRSVADRESSRGLCGMIVWDLREIVRYARDQLVTELGHSSLHDLRHDFADAPEGNE